ncbi:VWA domain-containing protein [bacterium]|nr:VWA domain-containing protein [bacterium]
MASNIKFALYDFTGTPKEFYFVDEVEVPKPVLEPTVSHHVVIVDRSGSMYSAMKDTRAMVEKVMVAEEFTNSELLLTLISYSSKGDFTLHFGRKKVSEVLDPNNGFVDQIRSIQATCLTSVSGALEESLKHVVAGETTAVSIHTDGWFNDSSPAAEAKLVDKWIKTVQKDFPNVYANTIAYGSWSDFKTLDRISQSLSGKTVIAKTVKQVFDALHDTTALLAGRVLPAIHVPKEDSDFLAVHNVTQKKVNGNTVDFAVKGVGPDDVTKLYRFKKVTQERWDKDKRVEAIGSDATPVYVFARSLLAVGRLNDAKYALCGTGDQTLLRQHYKDLTSEALAGFADDLDKRIGGDFDGLVASTSKGLGSSAGSVAELCQVLERHRKDFTLNLTETLKGYKRRSVKRLAGEWVNSTFVPSSTRLVPTDDAATVSVATFEINNSNATINMQVMRTADLYKDGVHVASVAGKKLDLREIRAYTLVGDGEVNLPSLTLKISSKKLHAALVEGGWLTGDFDHTVEYTIDLTGLAAVPFSQGVKFPPSDTFEHLMMLTVKRGLLSACLGGSAKADEWTPEQLEELKSHDLSASLNYNPKTTNPYTDLTVAISAGEIDSRTKFNVTLGDSRMVSVSSLYSANEYLARRFSVKGSDPAECDKDGNLKKPKLTDIVNGAAFSVKTLSARTKLNAIDDIMMPMFEQFMSAGFDGISRTSHRIDMVEALRTTEEEIEAFYASLIRPVAMYIGATGLIPEGWQVDVMDGEGLVAKFPEIDVAKKQKEEGTFFVNGSLVVGVFPEVAYFSTPKGIEAAKAISAASEE